MKSIPPRLRTHIEQSRRAVMANKAKGNRHGEILSVLYSNNSRFIDELLQNAEDALRRKTLKEEGDEKVVFKLFSNKLEFSHQGIDFDENDFIALTTFANSTKTGVEDVNLIGKFGIGFKSVFSVTDFPHIYSAGMAFGIEDYELLVPLTQAVEANSNNTLFVLPFRSHEKTLRFKELVSAFNAFDDFFLLFLHRIQTIEIFIEGRKSSILFEKEILGQHGKFRKIRLRSSGHVKKEQHFLLYEETENSPGFAFAVDEAFKLLSPVDTTVVYNGLPGYQKSGLHFFLNAAFATSPTRESIQLHPVKTPENLKCLAELEKHFYGCLLALRANGFFSSEALLCFPLAAENLSERSFETVLKASLHNVLLSYVAKGKKLPTYDGKWVGMSEAAFAEDIELASLMGTSGLATMFFKRNFLALPAKEIDRQQLGRFYEGILKIPKLSWEKFCFTLSLYPDFLASKSISWLKKFYLETEKREFLWNKENIYRYYSLRKQAFLRTRKHGMWAPYSSQGRLQVFLPGKYSGLLPELHSSLACDESLQGFFLSLGLLPATLKDSVLLGVVEKWERAELRSFQNDYIQDVVFLQQKASADQDLFASVYEEIFQKFPLPFEHSEVFMSYASQLKVSASPPKLGGSIQNLPPRQRNAFQRLWQQLSIASGQQLYSELNDSKDLPFSLPDIDLSGVAFYPFSEELEKSRNKKLEVSTGELIFPNFPGLILPDNKGEIPAELKKIAGKVVEKHFFGRGLQFASDPSGNWDFILSSEGKKHYISLALSAPLESNCIITPANLREAWRMHEDERGEEVSWYCLRWRSMREIDFVIINNPLKLMIEGFLDFNARIFLPG